MRNKVIIIVGAVVILTLIGVAWFAIKQLQCGAGFQGVDTRWGPIAGCTVEAKPGLWVPRNNFRVM